jgi:hypothetical protein
VSVRFSSSARSSGSSSVTHAANLEASSRNAADEPRRAMYDGRSQKRSASRGSRSSLFPLLAPPAPPTDPAFNHTTVMIDRQGNTTSRYAEVRAIKQRHPRNARSAHLTQSGGWSFLQNTNHLALPSRGGARRPAPQ